MFPLGTMNAWGGTMNENPGGNNERWGLNGCGVMDEWGTMNE